MKIVFLGRTQMLMNTIEHFEKSKYTIAGIGTCRAEEEYSVKEDDFQKKADELGVPFFCDSRINSQDIHRKLISMQGDLAVSVNWRTVINSDTIDLFRYGILNGHAGDLPRYRGNACPNWAIINGENQIGLSIHFMEPDSLDSGDIVVKEFIPVTNDTTIGEIYVRMEKQIPEMFLHAVMKVEEKGRTSALPQSKNHEDVLRCFPRVPSDSRIDWSSSCIDIDRLIRASGYPFQGAYTFLNGVEKIYIQEAVIQSYEFPSLAVYGQVVSRNCDKDCVGIAARDGVIQIVKICDEHHKECRVTEKIKSMRDRMGMCEQDRIYELAEEIEELRSMVCSNKEPE